MKINKNSDEFKGRVYLLAKKLNDEVFEIDFFKGRRRLKEDRDKVKFVLNNTGFLKEIRITKSKKDKERLKDLNYAVKIIKEIERAGVEPCQAWQQVQKLANEGKFPKLAIDSLKLE